MHFLRNFYLSLFLLILSGNSLYSQCTSVIPSNTLTGSANVGGSGSNIRLLCANDSVFSSGGGGNTHFINAGAYVSSSGGGSHIIYVKNGGTLDISGGGGSITVYYEAGAIINNTLIGGGSNNFILCANIVFDYTNFPQAPCNNCNNNLAITPAVSQQLVGNTATFTAVTSDPNPSFIWQSDFGQGYQTLNNVGNYSGTTSANLTISILQLASHNQPLRAISTSGICVDTSAVSIISIQDTCITNLTVTDTITYYDTLLTSVTDTLRIQTVITNITPQGNTNTLKVFPNPAKTHITIDYGDFNLMNGYSVTFVNASGQTVFTTQLSQQTSQIDLNTWTGSGLYFMQLIDAQNNTVENRKIVIQ